MWIYASEVRTAPVSFLLLVLPILFLLPRLSAAAGDRYDEVAIRIRSAGSGEPVVISTSLPIDCCSKYSNYGRAMRQNYEVMIDWISKHRGGVLVNSSEPPRPLEVEIYNDFSDPDRVRQIYDRLVNNMSRRLLLSTYSSGLGGIAANIVNSSDAVMLAPCSASPSVFIDRPNVYSTVTPSVKYLEGPIEVPARTAKSVSYVYESPSFTTSMCAIIPGVANETGMAIRYAAGISDNPSREEVRQVLTDLMQDPPDLFVGCVYKNACKMFLQEMKVMEFKANSVILSSCTGAEFQELMSESEYVIGMTSWLPEFPLHCEVTNRSNLDFVEEYATKYNEMPNYQGVSAQTSLLSYVQAIESGQSLDSLVVSSELRSMKMQTIFGQVSFDENGQGQNPFKGTQVLMAASQDIDLKIVSPVNVAEMGMMYPMPSWIDRECLKEADSQYGLQANSTCSKCPEGHVSIWESSIGTRKCQPCPAGTKPDLSYDSSGKIRAWCHPCLAGRYGPHSGMAECLFCPQGLFSNETGRQACFECEAGKSQGDMGKTDCAACSAGTHATSLAATKCDRCGSGKYTASRGASACDECTPGTTTQGLGSTGPGDCVCSRNFVFTGSGPATSLGNGNTTSTMVCQQCPVGLECDVGSVDPLLQMSSAKVPLLLPGFWADKEDPLLVYRCLNHMQCPGGSAGSCGGNFTGDVCGACEDGFIRTSTLCEPCGSQGISAAVWTVVFAMVLPAVILIAYWFTRKAGVPGARHEVLTIVAILIRNYQTLAFTKKTAVELPSLLSNTWEVWDFLLDLGRVLRPECAGLQTFGSKLALQTSGPVMLLLLFSLVYLAGNVVARMLQDDDVKGLDGKTLFSVFLSSVLAFYTMIGALALSLFMCYPHPAPNDSYSLLASPNILCYRDEWSQYVAVGVVAILVYIVGATSFVAYICYIAPRRSTEAWFQTAFRTLFLMYRPGVWWWCLVCMLQGLFMSFFASVFSNSVSKVSGVMISMLFYSAGVAAFMPFRKWRCNLIDIMSCGAMSFLLSTSFWYAGLDGDGNESLNKFVLLVSFLPLAVAACMAASMVAKYCSAPNSGAYEECAGELQEAMAYFGNASQKEAVRFLGQLSDGDIEVLKETRRTILAEMKGCQGSKRCTDQRIMFGAPSPSRTFDSGVVPTPDANENSQTRTPPSGKKVAPEPDLA